MLKIDGSTLSGSGTIVRLSVAIAALTESPLELANIRQRREKPGLRRQHLTALQALAEMTGGILEGAQESSEWVRFTPGSAPRGGDYHWDIGTAGSTTLLALTVLPLCLFADGPCRLRITGGVFQDFAPSGYHTQFCLIPLLARMGARIHMEIERAGYYPKGGGVLTLATEPLEGALQSLDLPKREGTLECWGIALSSHLKDRMVSERMAESCNDELLRRGMTPNFQVLYDHIAAQPGAALFLMAEDSSGSALGSDMAGARGRRSEQIGAQVARQLWKDLRTDATVDRHLADQLILFAALADGESRFRIPEKTSHVETNLWLVKQLLETDFSLQKGLLQIRGIGLRRSDS
jgi:RNA 3'-terminal phosphate cyclase (ATP)